MNCPDCHSPLERQEDVVIRARGGRLYTQHAGVDFYCLDCESVFTLQQGALVRDDGVTPLDVAFAGSRRTA